MVMTTGSNDSSVRGTRRVWLAVVGALLATTTLVTGGLPAAPSATASGWTVERVGETDRFTTAAKVSERYFTAPVASVVIASGEGFADALAGGAVAGARQVPLLLSARDRLPAATADELRRLRPSQVLLLGGVTAVSAAVASNITAVSGAVVERIAGADRYATAVRLSEVAYPGGAPSIYIASGEGFADGLAGGPSAAADQGPLLLVRRDSVPAVVATEIRRLGATSAVVLGGPQVVSDPVISELRRLGLTVTRRSGADRHATSVAIASQAFTRADAAVLVTGSNFPDALAAASLARQLGGPLLLTRGDCMPASVGEELRRLGVTRVVVVGGVRAVSGASAAGIRCQTRPAPIVTASTRITVHMSVGMTRALEYLAARMHVLGSPGAPVSARVASGGDFCTIGDDMIRAVRPGLCRIDLVGVRGNAQIDVQVVAAPARTANDRPGGNVLDLKPVYIRFSDSPDVRRDTSGEVASFAQGLADFVAVQHPGFTLRLDTVNGVPDVQHIQLPLTTRQYLDRWPSTDNRGPLGQLLIEHGVDAGLEGFYTPNAGFADLEGVRRILVAVVEAPRGAYSSPNSNQGVGCGSATGNAFVAHFVRSADGTECPEMTGPSHRFAGSMDELTRVDDAFRLILELLRANHGCNAALNALYGTPLETRPSSITSPQDPIGYPYAVGRAFPRIMDPLRRFYFRIPTGRPGAGDPCQDVIYSPYLTDWAHTDVHDDRVAGRSTGDRPDDLTGEQVRVLYVLPADAPDRRWDLDGRLHSAVSSANDWLYANGRHSVRFDTAGGRLDVSFVRLAESEAQLWMRPDGTKCPPDELCPHPRELLAILERMGALTPGKIHVLMWGGQFMPASIRHVGCGGALPGAAFLSPLIREPFTSWSGCLLDYVVSVPNSRNAIGLIVMHEIFHVLGAVDDNAPDADGGHHIGNDPTDLMGGSGGTVRLDPRRRNYWAHGRSDLNDVTRSPFLVAEPSSMSPPLHTSVPGEWWAKTPDGWVSPVPARRSG
jgi:putative cell wall-binding protein